MAVPTNTFATYNAVGIREDLIDVIVNISPTKTPVLSMTESVRAMSTLHEWQTDALTAPTSNASLEGDDSTAAAVVATSRLTNNTQILTKNFIISGTEEIVRKAGRASEIGYQTQKLTKELATDIEFALVINATATAGSAATARKMKGISGWVTTNISSGTADRSLTASVLDANLSSIWAAGGDPDVLLSGGAQKIAIAAFTQNTRYISAEAAKVVNAVDIYQSSFGTLKTVLSHVMNTVANSAPGTVFALDMSYWRKAWLRPVNLHELARTGDGRKFQLVAELTLESLNEKASGAVMRLL